MVKELYLGCCNLFDVLCDCYGIFNVYCVLYGVLLDVELLVEVYLLMMCGQNLLIMDLGGEEEVSEGEGKLELVLLVEVIVVVVSEEELGLYEDVFNQLDKEVCGSCVWCFELLLLEVVVEVV